MRIHFIAIGGAVMHNLAIALKRQGHVVSGSDDKIADPAKTNLEKEGLMPSEIGFFERKITPEIEAIILGMHARIDNEELVKAQSLGIKIYSFPHFVYEFAKEKKRIVVAGSHGKTSITSMIMHVLKVQGMSFDYMVGAAVKGFDTAVKLSNEAPIIILEGDEYLASPLHLESKFMFYAPHLSLVSGVAWDHINVFPVYKDYVHQFAKLFSITSDRIVYFEGDSELQQIAKDYKGSANLISYNSPSFNVDNEKTFVKVDDNIYPLQVFGEHNLQNIEAAREACAYLGVNKDAFYKAIGSFEGAANRLQKLAEKGNTVVFKDFAHSPSKLKATVKAVRSQYPERKIIAIMELHTFSSLNKAFWEQYKDSMDDANGAVVFIDSETLRLKNMQIENVDELPKHFNKGTLVVIQQKEDLEKYLLNQHYENTVLLLMTSGTFGGLSISNLIEAIFES